MGVSPVKGVGGIEGPADAAERPPERDVHHCAPGYRAPNVKNSPSNRRTDQRTKATRSGGKCGAGNSLLYQRIPRAIHTTRSEYDLPKKGATEILLY